METKHRVSDKILSMFLAVLMAVSCFSVAMPGLAPTSKAAASDEQWTTLINAFTSAYSGGYLSTDSYAVSDDGAGNYTVEDTSLNGYIYNVVRAIADIAVAESASADRDHNATLREFIKTTIVAKGYDLNDAQKEFIDKILPVPEEDTKPYYWYSGNVWQGASTEVSSFAPVKITVTVSRSVKAAVLSDYSAAADVPASVQTEYCLTTDAAAHTGESALGAGYSSVWYQNDSVAVSSGTAAAPDLSALLAYLSFVQADEFAAEYAEYVEDNTVLFERTAEELAEDYEPYMALLSSANTCDGSYVEKFIGATYMNAYSAYVQASYNTIAAVNLKPYVDWIKGISLTGLAGFENTYNRDQYKADGKRTTMVESIAQAGAFLNIINAAGSGVISNLVAQYGYDTSAYANYITELQNALKLYDLNDIKNAYDYITRNSAPSEYTFPETSQFFTEAEYILTTDTSVDPTKEYFIYDDVTETYTKVALPAAAGLRTYYEYVPSYSIICAGNESYYSQPYVESGHVCPVTDEDLMALSAWVSAAYSFVSSASAAQRDSVFSAAEYAAFGTLRNALNEECDFRAFDDTNAAFTTEYRYFINLMLNVNPSSMSNVALYGRADDTSTTDVDESVVGLLNEATAHYDNLNVAYNACAAASSNNSVKSRYSSFRVRAYNYITNIYAVLFSRGYNQLTTVLTDAGGSLSATPTVSSYGSITATNFSLVKAGISTFDEDNETEGYQNELYSWLVSNRSMIIALRVAGANHYSVMAGIINRMNTWQTDITSVMSRKWANFQTVTNDGGSGTYATRYAREDDMVRYIGATVAANKYNYTVTNTKMERVIEKLDTFINSESFVKLIGVYEEGTVEDLSTFIENLLIEKVFTDEIVNLIVGMLFPMVCDLINTQLIAMLRDLKINNTAVTIAPENNADVTVKLDTLANAVGGFGDISISAGYLDAYLNGKNNTVTLASALNTLNLKIFPTYFSQALPSSINGVSLSSFKSALTSAGLNWMYFDTYMQNVNGKAREGYGDGEINGDDLSWVKWGVTDFSSAVNALGAVFDSIKPLAQALFCNYTYSTDTIEDLLYASARGVRGEYDFLWGIGFSIGGATGYGSGHLVISGIQGFNNLWAPLFEALGVNTYASSYATGSVTVSNAISRTIGTSGSSASSAQLVHCLLMPLYSLIKTVAANPLATVTSILPNIAYNLAYDCLQPLLGSLTTNLRIVASVEIDEASSVNVSGIPATGLVNAFKGAINGALENIVDASIPLDIGGMLDLNSLLGADVSNLNDLAELIFGMIGSDSDSTANKMPLPAINAARLGCLGTRTTRTGSPRSTNFNNGLSGGSYYYVVADKADVLYDVLNWALRLVASEGSLSGLLANFGIDSLPEAVEDILSGIDTNNALAALVELFLPRGIEGSGYATGYDMADYDWYIPGSSASTYSLTQSSFVYIKYQNDWTAPKAKYMWENIDGVVNDILDYFGGDTFEGYSGINEWLVATINGIFDNQGIMNVLNLLVRAGAALDGDNMIAGLIKDQIKINGYDANIDIMAWYSSFGYLVGENRVLGTYERTVDGVDREFTEFVYRNEEGRFCVGYNPNQFQSGADFAVEFVRTYPLAPSGFAGFNMVAGEYVPVTANGDGRYGSVTRYYNYVVNEVDGEEVVTYPTVSANVDTYYANAFSDLRVRVGEADENDNYYYWSVRGNSFTSSWGLANGVWYELIDDSENARALFTAIFCAMATPFMPIVGLLFTSDDLSLFNGALTIKGYNCYDGAIIPVMEMLGVHGLKTQAQYTAAYKISSSNATAAAGGFYYLVNELFSTLNNLLSYGADGSTPIQHIIELLPQIFYFVQSDGITAVLKNLLMPIWVLVDTVRPVADVDLDDLIHQFLCNKLGYVYDKSSAQYASEPVIDVILNLIGLDYIPYTQAQAQADKSYVDAIYKLTVEDLRLEKLYDVAEIFTGLDLSPLTYALEGMCVGYTDINGNTHNVHSYNSSYSKTAYTLDYYGPDIITVTISTLLDLIRYKNNEAALDELFDLTRELLPNEDLADLTVSGLIDGLSVVFEERVETAIASPNWDYLLEGKTVRRPDNGQQVAWVDGSYDLLREFSDVSMYHSIYNLAYKTDWTYDTANATDKMLTNILDYVTSAFLSNETESFTSFSEYINGVLDQNVFSGDVLKTIAGLMASLYNLIPASAVGLIDELVNINMTAWLDAGYVQIGLERLDPADVENKGENALAVDLDGDGSITEADYTHDRYVVTVNEANGVVTKVEYEIKEGATTATVKDDATTYFAPVFKEVEVDENGTTVTKQVVDYYYAATNASGVLATAKDYVVNYEFKWWADAAATDYVDTREEFMAALEEIISPAANLFGFIFLEDDYRFLYTAGDNLAGTGDDTDAIVLDGIGAYAKAVIPILEALGVDLSNYQPSKYYDAATDSYYSSLWIEDMFDVFVGLIDEILKDPLNWIIDRLPGVIYFLNAKGLSASIDNIFDSVSDLLESINTILDLGDRISTANLAGVDISNLNFAGVLKLVERFTGIHVRDDLVEYMESLYVGNIRYFWSANGTIAFTMDCSDEEDRADLITIIISVLLEIVTDEGKYIDPDNNYNYTYYNNPAAIDKLIMGDEYVEGETGMVGQIISAVKNPTEIQYSDIDWNYFDKEYNLADNTDEATGNVTTPGFAFQYLNYSTQWTYDKAAATSEGFEGLICGVLGLVDEESFGELESLGNIINLDTVYTGESLQKVLDLVAGLLYGEDAILERTLIDVIGCMLGADLTEWDGNYAFGGNDTFAKELGITYTAPVRSDYATEAEYNAAVKAAQEAYSAAVEATLAIDAETGLYVKEIPVYENEYTGTVDTEIDSTKTYYTLTADNEFVVVETPVAADLATYFEAELVPSDVTMKTYLVNDRETFISGLTHLLHPAYKLLSWLLFDDSYEFFTGNVDDTSEEIMIKIQGADGYRQALVLLLEAFGCKNLSFRTKYVNADGTTDMETFVSDILTSICNRLDEILEDPAYEIVGLLPELIYYINAGGLQNFVSNILAGPLALVESVPALADLIGAGELSSDSVVDDLICGLLDNALLSTLDRDEDGTVSASESTGFTMKGINLGYVMTLVEKLTGLEITDVLQNSLSNFRIGQITSYASRSEKIAYKMSFRTSADGTVDGAAYYEDFADFVTILLSFVIDVVLYEHNGAAIAELAGIDPALIQGVINFIREGYTVNVENIDWFYFDTNYQIHNIDWDDATGTPEYTYTGSVLNPGDTVNVPERTINYLTYASDWTADTATYIARNRNEIIAAVLNMAGLGNTTLADIIKQSFDVEKDLYTAGTLNSILDLIAPVFSVLPAAVTQILGIALDIDLSVYSTMCNVTGVDYVAVAAPTAGELANYFEAAYAPTADTTVQTYKTYYVSGADGYTAVSEPVSANLGEYYELQYTVTTDTAVTAGKTYFAAVATDACDYFKAADINGSRQAFIQGLVTILLPLSPILDWLLFGKNIQYFDKKDLTDNSIEILIDLPGADGYKYGLVPLLEALGVTLPEVTDETATENILFALINNVLVRAEVILDNPVDEVLELLPNILYFINTNGLSTCINNLLSGVVSILDRANEDLAPEDQISIADLLSGLLNGLPITIDLKQLDLLAIVTILEQALMTATFVATADTAIDAEKSYYTKNAATYTAVEAPSASQLSTYYEVSYALTTDTAPVTGKTYYVLGVEGYTTIATPDAAAMGTYYEASFALTSDASVNSGKVYYEKDIEGFTLVNEPAAEDLANYYERVYTGGIAIEEILTKTKIDMFYLGEMVYFTSANGKPAYRMVYSDEEGMEDMLTIIVNLVIEVLLYKNGETGADNAKAIDALINGTNPATGEPLKSTVQGIVNIILGLAELDEMPATDINWNYFDETVELGEITVPANAFVYLDYSNQWTYDVATTLDSGLTDLINEILALTAGEGETPQTINDLVSGLVDLDELLSADLLNSILDMVAPMLYGENSILNETLLNLIGLVLGADLTQWNNTYRFEALDAANTYTTDAATGLKAREGSFTVDGVSYEGTIYAIEHTEDFSAALAYVLDPASRLLGWLLLGQDYRFFVSNTDGNVDGGERQDGELIVVPGFNGYDTSLVILLEALGFKSTGDGGFLKPAASYFGNEQLLVKDIIDAAVLRVDEILANPIDEILGLIPEILYFINAGGLNAVVTNLAGGLLQIVDYVNASGLLDEPIAINGTTLDSNIIDTLISTLLNEALADTLDKDGDGELGEGEQLYFVLADVNLQWIIEIVEAVTGLEIDSAIGYSLEKFALGEVVAYTSLSTAYDETYKMRFADSGDHTDYARDRADMITILLSVIIDVLSYKDEENEIDNAAALENLIINSNSDFAPGTIDAIVNIINGWTIDMMNIDWFYFDEDKSIYTTVVIDGVETEVLKDPLPMYDENTDLTMPVRTINYLSYNSNWTEQTAEYLVNNIEEIIAVVLGLLGQEDTDLAAIIAKSFTLEGDLYTAANLNAIANGVASITGNLGDTLLTLVGLLLESDLEGYENIRFDATIVNSRATFIDGLVEILQPLYGILDWILFGKDLTFLYDNDFYNDSENARDLITLSGAEGYAYGLVPILEALGITNLPNVDATTRLSDTFLRQLLNAVLDRVEMILAEPVYEILQLLPNLLYFINTNGLAASIHNLVAVVFGLLEEINPLLVNLGVVEKEIEVNEFINDLLGETLNGTKVDIFKLDLLSIARIIEGVTGGLKIVDVLTANKMDNFYLGQISYFKSSNGKAAFRMDYSDTENEHDMITILLNTVVEILVTEGNKEVLCTLLGLDDDTTQTVDAVINLLTNPTELSYKGFNWNYFNETAVLGETITVNKSDFMYLAYANDWTFEKATALDSTLVSMVDQIIGMVNPDVASLSDLINGNVDLDALVFNADNLNSLLTLVAGLFYGENAVIPSVIGELAGLLLGAEITEWNDQYAFEALDATKTYYDDTVTGLKYRVEAGKAYYAIDGSADFINGLCTILKPADKLLSFLLLGDNYGFFVDNETGENTLLTIPGAEGYAKGLALLLEALGVKGLKSTYANADEMLREVLTCVVDRITEILANPIDEVLALIPEIIYFINANGLSVVVNNLAASVFNIVNSIDDTLLNVDELIDGVIKGISADAPTFALDGINIQWVIDLVEVILKENLGEIKINEVLANSLRGSTYPLSTFALGKAEKYDSVSAFDTAYKCVFGDGTEQGGANRADMITIILSFVIDFVRNDTNAATIETAAGLTAGTVSNILAVISEYAINIDPDIDWFYFDKDFTFDPADGDLTMPASTINYLTYASDWTETAADYLDDNLDAIVAAVIDMTSLAGTSVADIVKGLFDPATDLYTAENLNKIATAIKDLTASVQAVILDVAGILLDVDLHAWDDMTFEEGAICDKETFVAGLCEVIAPIATVLDWLLFGDDYAFFNRINEPDGTEIENLLVINGYDGYAYGLVPLFEALGVALTDVSNRTAEDYNTMGQLNGVLTAVLDRLEVILSNPVEEVLALIPNILYFINANGLAASVNHLAGAALALVEKVNPVLKDLGVEINGANEINVDDLINGLLTENGIDLTVSIKKLDLVAVFEIVEALTGLSLIEVVTEQKLDTFYLGQLVNFTSANGQPAFRMVYSEDTARDRSDLITIVLNYLVETLLYPGNAAALDILINGDEDNDGEPDAETIATILEMLSLLGTEPLPGDYHWNYFNESSDSDIPEHEYTAINPPVTPFYNYLTYCTDWTQKTANTLYDNLADVVDAILTMTNNGDTTLAQVIAGSFNLYTADNLNALLDLIKQLYSVADIKLINALGLILGCDLTYWNGLTYTDIEIYDADTFARALTEIVEPVFRVLDWLLFGKDYGFLVDNETGEETLLNIAGADGYIFGLAPIFSALGVNLPKFEDGYTCATEVTVDGTQITFFEAVIRAVLARVDEVLADPINEALDLLPGLLYFINANGVSTAAFNIVGGLLNAINVLVASGMIELDGESIEEFLANELGIDIRNLDLEGILGYLESAEITKGIIINEIFKGDYVVGDGTVTFTHNADGEDNILEKFYVGKVESYTYSGFNGWKMINSVEGRGDIITTLLSLAFEIVFYEANEEPLANLFASFIEGFTVENFRVLKALLTTGVDLSEEMKNIDWVYFNEYATDAERDQAILDVLSNPASNVLPATQPVRTIHYLEYDNNWNEETASYLDENLTEIVDLIVAMATNGENADLAALLESLNLFSSDNAEALIRRVGDLLARVDDSILEAAGVLLDVDIMALKNYKVGATFINNSDLFVKELVNAFKGLGTLLDWLLFDREYTFFTDLETGLQPTITLKGGEGYKYGLAPILAALGVETDISAALAAATDTEKSITEQVLYTVLTNVANRINEIFANPIDEVFNLLLNLVYFINADGVSVSVMNLVAPVEKLLTTVGEQIGRDLSLTTLITAVDLSELNFPGILELIKDRTGLDVYGAIGEYLSNFYFGQLESFTSFDGIVNFKMVYSDTEQRHDFITVLVTLVLDVFDYAGNEETLKDMLGEDIYMVIKGFLHGSYEMIPMQNYDWLFVTREPIHPEWIDSGIAVSPITLGSIFDYIYGPLYTRAMGEYITKWLPDFIDTMIVLLGIKDKSGIGSYDSLEDLLDELIGGTIYKQEYVQAILDLIKGLVPQLRDALGAELFNHIAAVVNNSLGVDLNYWNDYTVNSFAEGDKTAFVNEIVRMLRPAYPILEWLLTSKNVAFFNDAEGSDYIVLKGAEGYSESIIPILEALRCDEHGDAVLTPDAYKAAVDADPTKDALLINILNPILGRLDQILANPLDEILNELPAVMYFLNSNGLDTAIRNLLNAGLSILEHIKPLLPEDAQDKNFYQLVGIDDLSEINVEGLIDTLLSSVLENTGFQLKEVAMEAIKELTVGCVRSFTSKNGKQAYTMDYATGADKVDLVTVILRLVLKFVSIPENVTALKSLLAERLSGDGYTLVCSLLENFSQMVSTADGMDKVMYTVYQIFYAANVAAHETENGLADFNGNYSFLNQLFATSSLSFMRQIAASLGAILDNPDPSNPAGDIIDSEGVLPNGAIPFFQKIIDFFQKIMNFFRNLFS